MTRSLFLPLAALALATLILSGCGRKGDLDVPGTPVAEQNVNKTKKEPVEDRKFFLDPLL
ncbi:lipoprotein [Rhizobium sp. TH2]|uniref:LPS translocon maturation chaperone LptM n=1 Tax=Rhizobium sp. TH2 TaxID=2775403 RepID=UPI00215829F6|nr:lipoprotein [Rhizobium sp. TH2]UVC08279.1 lipoprotein [Rhizobium sp. TH2]